MNPVFDPLTQASAALAPATARFDRQHAGARQQRWLAELEQAMLAQQPGRRPVDNDLPPAPQDEARSPAAAHVAPATHDHAAGASGQDNAAAAQQDKQAVRDDDAPDGTGAANGPAQHAAAVAGTDPGQPGIQAGAMTVAAAAAGATTQAGLVGVDTRAVVVAAATEQPPLPAVAGVSAARAGIGFALAGMQHRGDDAAETMAPPEPATPDEAAGEEYSRNLLHLFHGEDGVQAYIRDAELTGAQMRAVAQALAAELGGSGTRLAALTVNGRRVPLAGGGTDDSSIEQPNEDMPATAHDAARYGLPIAEKGNI